MSLTKPPLPSSTIWDCLRIPLQGWVEWAFGFFALVALWAFLETKLGPGAYVAFYIFGGVMTLVVLGRLLRKVINLRNVRGPMRGKGLAAFWLMLLLPIGALGGWLMFSERDSVLTQRQADAKQDLILLYQAEENFKNDFGTYTQNLKELGFNPSEEDTRHYMVGFPTACAAKAGLADDRSQREVQNSQLAEARKLEIVEYFRKVRNAEDCKDSKLGFEVYAVGIIKENAPLDVWRIDETKKLTHVQEGR